MGIATIIGIVVAIIGVMGGFVIEGGSPMSLFNIPGFMIVVVGTLGATITSFPLSSTLAIPGSFIRAMTGGAGTEPRAMAEHLVSMADKARREGLLSLEEDARSVTEPFARKGLMLMIDGTDPEALKSIMEIDMDQEAAREAEKAEIWKAGSGFAPTLGVLGAVMGLITVLGNLGGDVAALGHGIAVAFVATFYGVGMANVLLLPVATKLSAISGEEMQVREMILEGVLSIQAGDNPRIVKEKLQGFLAPSDRMRDEDDDDDGGAEAEQDEAA
ncbi:MAG: flagellar motor protein [Dehalococcoidia bacterium]|nr:flagellar motor protein [Dehalococcoidia bacterium]